MIPAFSNTTDASDFDASREPMRAIRDLIGDCEAGAFEGGNPDVLRRAQEAFTALRALHGDTRPGEEIAFAPMREPKDIRGALQMTAGALQCVVQLLPAGEQHVVNFTGDWARFGSLSIASILNRADTALDGVKS